VGRRLLHSRSGHPAFSGTFSAMSAGVTAPYDHLGSETQDLLYNSWPRRPGEHMAKPLLREFNTTSTHYGTGVSCNAGQSYMHPEFSAGKSKRISAAYQKTGVLSNRCEEGFRDTKAPGALTEGHTNMDYIYGTQRQTLREQRHLPMGGSMVLHGQSRARPPSPARSISVRSGASGRSNRSNRSQVSQTGSQGGASRRSQTSSRASHASRAPSWFQESSGAAWNFEPLPMYERTNESYGKVNRSNFRGLDHTTHAAAGKSESGWLEPDQLIKTLTRPHGALEF
jgi:hypothetical protein